jgi:hypothetical protein
MKISESTMTMGGHDCTMTGENTNYEGEHQDELAATSESERASQRWDCLSQTGPFFFWFTFVTVKTLTGELRQFCPAREPFSFEQKNGPVCHKDDLCHIGKPLVLAFGMSRLQPTAFILLGLSSFLSLWNLNTMACPSIPWLVSYTVVSLRYF